MKNKFLHSWVAVTIMAGAALAGQANAQPVSGGMMPPDSLTVTT